MADCAIILYLECLIDLIYHFKKLGQRDLNKKIYIKICKKHILKLLINHQADFNEIYVRWSSKKGYLSLFKSF